MATPKLSAENVDKAIKALRALRSVLGVLGLAYPKTARDGRKWINFAIRVLQAARPKLPRR